MKFKAISIFIFLLSFVQNSNSENNLAKAEDLFNVGNMSSYDNNFTLFFKTRKKAILAKGEEFNYITDYPQDLYIYDKKTKKSEPLITYDWFPNKVKMFLTDYDFPIFPEDFAYYLLNDNRTIVMISAIKSINQNFKYDIKSKKLEKLSSDSNFKFMISSIIKSCDFKSMNDFYECNYYKPLISQNLIN